MNKSKPHQRELVLFREFCESPRDSGIVTIQGSHKYISLAIRGEIPTPKKSILTELFKEFSTEPIKDYIFKRIPKRMLLELALCVLQDIISKGTERAKSLQLVVAKTSSGEKTVVINGADDDTSVAGAAADPHAQINDAIFHLSDKHGKSPNVSLAIGENRDPAYQPPDKQGYFTPARSARKSLRKDFEVSEYTKFIHKSQPHISAIDCEINSFEWAKTRQNIGHNLPNNLSNPYNTYDMQWAEIKTEDTEII